MNAIQFAQFLAASALVSAIVSGGITAIVRHYDRMAERRRLLVEKSIELARAKIEMDMRVVEHSGVTSTIYDPLVLAERYFGWLEYLEKHGKLPDDPRLSRLPK